MLRIGQLTTAYHTSFVLRGLGWIENRIGEEVEWRVFGGGPPIVNAMEKGELDLGYIGLPPTMIGVERGVRIVCVAGGHVEGTTFVAKPNFKTLEEKSDSVTETLKQFSSIGSPPKGSIHDVILRNLLKEAGLEDRVAVVNFDWADFIPEAMMSGEIDATVGTPPLAVLCQRAVKARQVIPPGKIWPSNPSYGIIAQKSMLEKHRETVLEFIRLHEEATNLMRKEMAHAASIIAGVMEVVDKEFITEALKISPRYCASLPHYYIDSTMRFVPVLQRMGYIKRPLNREEIFDISLVEEVHTEPPHYMETIK
jgi:NitT/TauT family transport system substrate-binding protein